MAWACQNGFTKRLNMKILGFRKSKQLVNFLNALVLVLLLSNFGSSSFELDCRQIKNCYCGGRMDSNVWDIECPNEILESYDLTLRIVPVGESDLRLTVTCSIHKEGFNWSLIQGLNLGHYEKIANVSELHFQYCNLEAQNTSENALISFAERINLNAQNIKSFRFTPSPRFSSPNFSALLPLLTLMKNLEKLDVQKLNLKILPNFAFLPLLKDVIFSSNSISALEVGALAQNLHLQDLDLRENKIENFPQNSLPSSLLFLNIASNKIVKLENSSFDNLKNLEYLIINSNPIVSIEREAFQKLEKLKSLNMDNLQLESVPNFSNMKSLKELSISYVNSTKSLEVELENVTTLEKLSLISIGLEKFPILKLNNLKTLKLSENKISEVPADALKYLENLKTLEISNNRIKTVENLQGPELTSLDLSFNEMVLISQGLFAQLTNLISLNLKNNKIGEFHERAMRNLGKLEELDLSHNQISFENDDKMSNDGGMSEDFLYGFSHSSPLKFCTKLKDINLSHNKIKGIFTDWLTTFSVELKSFNLSHNELTMLHATDLTFIVKDLMVLDLSWNNISSVLMEHADAFLESSNTERKELRILLNNNPLNCDCNVLAFKKFKLKGYQFITNDLKCTEPIWLQNEQFSQIKNTDLMCPLESASGCPFLCTCWKVPENSTIIIDCSFQNLTNSYIPDISHFKDNLASSYNFTLNLAGNGIEELGINHTQKITPRVLRVDLSENELTSLAFLSLLTNNNVTSFNLAHNKFPCSDCEFHRMLRSQFKRLNDYQNISCLFEQVISGSVQSGNNSSQMIRILVDEFPEDRACFTQILKSEVQALIIFFSLFIIFLILLIFLYFRYGWALRAFLYSKGYGCCFAILDEGEEDNGKIYDAFVSYSHKDEDWVLKQLVPRLEEEDGFKLCLHFRDWTPGDWIPDQIVKSVDKSRRTVVILSKNFVESIWSRLEFKAAHAQALNERANRLILVMMDDELKESDIQDDDLKVYMKMNTYLKYDDPWFWHKLKYALPHKKSTDNQTNLQKQEQRERAIQLDKLRAKMETSVA